MKQALCTVGFAALCLTWAASAAAQATPDHLKCYKVRDPQAKTTYTADLSGLVAEPGCTIKLPAITACVPATKTNVTPTPPGGGGSGMPNSFFCYKVKCPKATLPTLAGTDQFGSRTVTPSAAKLLCAPLAGPSPVALCDISCAPVTCASEGALCEPCSGGPRLVRIGNGFCSRTVEGDLRCQSVSCDVPASNCTSSANCPANKFCSFDPSQGANTCCPLCEAALSIPATCPFEGANCGKFVDTDSVKSDSGGISRACRTGPGFYDEGFCQPTVEGDLQCQAGGCLSTTCTSSGECGSGFFCGRDAGGPGVDLCCPLCQ